MQFVVPVANIDTNPARYRVDDAAHIALRRTLRGFAPPLEIVGVYHSHPNGAAWPSESDVARGALSRVVSPHRWPHGPEGRRGTRVSIAQGQDPRRFRSSGVTVARIAALVAAVLSSPAWIQTLRAEFVGRTVPPQEASVDLLFVPVFGEDDSLADVPGLDEATGGEIARARSSSEFRGKLYDIFVTPVTDRRVAARRVALVGAGRREEADAERLRRIAAACGYTARRRGVKTIGWVVREGLDPLLTAQHAADGLSAAEFDGASYKHDEEAEGRYPDRVEIVAPGGDGRRVDDAVQRGRIIGDCANLTRALSNEPANVLTPREFAARVSAAATAVGLAVDVLDEQRIRDLGMRLLLGVAQGSAEPPRLIVLRHRSDRRARRRRCSA